MVKERHSARLASFRWLLGPGPLIFVFVLAVALIGPQITPHQPSQTVGIPGTGPSRSDLLGTDALGRDVLSRVLAGGWTVVLLAAASVLVAYGIGGLLGLVAGYGRRWIDPLAMRLVDVLISIPSILLLLLLLEGFGSSIAMLIFATALVQAPFIARLVRAATLEVSVASFVEAATARGERTSWLLRNELLPNIARPITADFGLRASYAVVLIATVNYLGLGLAPGTVDWGLMVAENQTIFALNVWALLAPAIMIALLTIGFNLLGDALLGRRDARATRRARSSHVPAVEIGTQLVDSETDVAPVSPS
jgi:ABC-type dipeptide/oligopeptide/nickel transport system permease subunit